nr:MAG TPA: hypothetical protein [Caudoviricetes sp.]
MVDLSRTATFFNRPLVCFGAYQQLPGKENSVQCFIEFA